MGSLTSVTFTPLRQIAHPKGDIYHALKNDEPGFAGFGEAYFTSIIGGETKGWKKHTRMILNLLVPIGDVRFHVLEAQTGQHQEFVVGKSNYGRLMIPPGFWTAFTGITKELNLILNIANIPHDPTEAENAPLDAFAFAGPE